MRFTQEFTVRWHDTDRHLLATPSAVMTYLQETANTQCETLGPSIQRIRDEQGLAFILSKLSLRLYAPIRAYDTLQVSTFIAPPHGFVSQRGFEIVRNDETVGRAVSYWALWNIEDHSLARWDDIPFGLEPEPMPELSLPSHVRFPKETAPCPCPGDFRVSYFDTDYNGHMNNTRYLNLLCGFLPQMTDSTLSTLTLCYTDEAKAGELLTAETATAEEAGETVHYVRTLHADGTPNAQARITLTPIKP